MTSSDLSYISKDVRFFSCIWAGIFDDLRPLKHQIVLQTLKKKKALALSVLLITELLREKAKIKLFFFLQSN